IGAGDQVAPAVGLAFLPSSEVPFAAVLAAAAHVRDREHAAAVEPRLEPWAKARLVRVAVRAVSVDQDRRASVAREHARRDDRERDARAVVAYYLGACDG